MYEQVSVYAQKKESGELSILLREFGLPLNAQTFPQLIG